ncbi:hypothetical protein D6853_11505 [Butyrivibrio sp. X503]|uniref:5-bromo-4-chloroindolyl phosphate hydrolysis family protein n=1 Tax=Butyrivibrio sp. X503 TaxID=2364878 RepID=UPI000EA86366|nr:5-bromo-4-chloroindolyl phosphate hydrolysis family protein [Butyrivibrio sp. X503]RKM54855.1 hypothetical protein D6853_11505 [Butyrivibrio sp. X503]
MAKNIQDELVDVGKDILKSVSAAIDSNDYSKLASDITRSVKSVSIPKHTIYSSGGQGRVYRQQYNAARIQRQIPFLQKRVNRSEGFLSVFFGSFFGAIAGVGALFTFIMGATPAAIALGAIFGMMCFVIHRGAKKHKLTKKYYDYGRVLGTVEYFDISALAQRCLKSDEAVLKDIKKLIKEGYLPRARLDATEKTCMITDNAYQMYLGAEKDRVERERKELEEANKKARQEAGLPGTAKDILGDGTEYIKFVRTINDKIPDTEEMSDKLYRLEEIMNKIFAQVRKNPESADELHKLMDYYLPTTKKLLSAYIELEKQPDLDNVTKTKAEISDAMDTINEAFENLLDSLFQDMAWDISSDISVMKTMMAQDGLTAEGQGVAMQMKSE